MKLAEALKLSRMPAPERVEPFRLFLATGFETLHLSTFLSAHLRRRLSGRLVQVETGAFGDLPGNIARLTASSALAGAVVLEWEDFDLRLGLRRLGGWGPKALLDTVGNVERRATELTELLVQAAAAKPIALSLPTLSLPPIFYQSGNQAGEAMLRLHELLASFARQISAVRHIKVVNPYAIDQSSPTNERRDLKSLFSTGFPYALSHATVVAEHLAALIQPTSPKKGIITDLDDTLWRGILGDDGLSGISWDLDHHSHIHALYQQLLAALAESGVLVAIASKNDPALARQALARKDLLIPLDRFYPLEISWGRKSEAVTRILAAWNIGPESVVFVDDSVLELEEVKASHPLMETRLFTAADDQAAFRLLASLRDLFGKERLAEEDALRMESLRRRSEVEAIPKAASQDAEGFLQTLEAQVTFSLQHDANDERVLELINKTNQFNLNGRRFTTGELKAATQEPGAFVLVVSYHDKFGPLGKIGVLLGQELPGRIRVQSWVMSCRAFSRCIEEATLKFLFARPGVDHIDFDFHPTERNGPLREFLKLYASDLEAGLFSLDAKTFDRLARPTYLKMAEV